MRDLPDNARLRSLPSIEELLHAPQLSPLLEGHPRPRVVAALRRAVDAARQRLLQGQGRGFSPEDVAEALGSLTTPALRPVHNATGVVLHTNLGRAPLAAQAVAQLGQVGSGYCNLELDLDEGERGNRDAAVAGLLCELTGAEDALVVNNGAAAALLVLKALAEGREGIVSRGELVEIGGGFRVPDVMAESGVKLVEVGTTNRTRASDYERALGPQVGVLIKVHRSNFAQVGFTEDTSVESLSHLAVGRGVPLYVDMGSGLLTPLVGEGLTSEPTMRAVVAAGADVVSFSGDKLLGGPQAGVVVGRRSLLARLRRHPLNRAVRVDKLVLAALEATLQLYRDGLEAEVPARKLLTQGAAALKSRAEALCARLVEKGLAAHVVATTSQVGGGAMPLSAPPSFAVALPGPAEPGFSGLRAGRTPVIARISEGHVLLDVRCLSDAELASVADAVAAAGFDKGC